MNIVKGTILIAATSLLLSVQARSQDTAGSINTPANKVLSDKYGIKIYLTDGGNLKTGKLNFSNSSGKNTIIAWNVIDNTGKISYSGGSMTLPPAVTVSVALNADLQNALNGKDSSVQFIVKN